ncbi:hypothetical protein D3C71_1576180 [compost metagenome]
MGPGQQQIPHLRRHLLAAGLHPAVGAADHLRLRPVRHHRVCRPRVVRLQLPAEHLDLAVHVVRKGHRGRPQPAHQAGRRALEPEQTGPAHAEAQPVAGHWRAHRADLRRLLHADPPAGRRTVHLATGRRGAVLGAVLHRRHLHQRRAAARSGVPAHVPLCALPERDVRQGHPGGRL